MSNNNEPVAWAVLDSRGTVCVAYTCREAAEAYCEGTFNRLAPLYRQPQTGSLAWIPVTERLPGEYEHVLGWNRGWCRAAEVWRNTGGEWCGGDYESVGRITHWMPLPAPPYTRWSD